jgi:hypothetical protein
MLVMHTCSFPLLPAGAPLSQPPCSRRSRRAFYEAGRGVWAFNCGRFRSFVRFKSTAPIGHIPVLNWNFWPGAGRRAPRRRRRTKCPTPGFT